MARDGDSSIASWHRCCCCPGRQLKRQAPVQLNQTCLAGVVDPIVAEVGFEHESVIAMTARENVVARKPLWSCRYRRCRRAARYRRSATVKPVGAVPTLLQIATTPLPVPPE